MLKFLLVSKDRKYSAESNNKMREELDRRRGRWRNWLQEQVAAGGGVGKRQDTARETTVSNGIRCPTSPFRDRSHAGFFQSVNVNKIPVFCSAIVKFCFPASLENREENTQRGIDKKT